MTGRWVEDREALGEPVPCDCWTGWHTATVVAALVLVLGVTGVLVRVFS